MPESKLHIDRELNASNAHRTIVNIAKAYIEEDKITISRIEREGHLSSICLQKEKGYQGSLDSLVTRTVSYCNFLNLSVFKPEGLEFNNIERVITAYKASPPVIQIYEDPISPEDRIGAVVSIVERLIGLQGFVPFSYGRAVDELQNIEQDLSEFLGMNGFGINVYTITEKSLYQISELLCQSCRRGIEFAAARIAQQIITSSIVGIASGQKKHLPPKEEIYLKYHILNEDPDLGNEEAANRTFDWIEANGESLEECRKRVGLASIDRIKIDSFIRSCNNNRGVYHRYPGGS